MAGLPEDTGELAEGRMGNAHKCASRISSSSDKLLWDGIDHLWGTLRAGLGYQILEAIIPSRKFSNPGGL